MIEIMKEILYSISRNLITKRKKENAYAEVIIGTGTEEKMLIRGVVL